jgi:type IV secretion system protein VirD4
VPLPGHFSATINKLVSHSSLLKLWLSALVNIITSRDTRPPCSTLFIVDELAQLGTMPQIKQAVTLTRGYGVRAMLFLQSPSQLKTLFPTDHEVITENCGTLVTFGHHRIGMSRAMAEIFGDISEDRLASLSPRQLAVKQGSAPTRIFDRIDYLTQSPFATRAQANPMFANLSPPSGVGVEKG